MKFPADGNSKDTIRVGRNMEYDYQTQAPIPDLQDFLDDLVLEVLMSVFFQYRSETKIDMLRLPLIMSKSLRGKKINNDVNKKTIMEKEFTYSQETLEKFQAMIDNKELSIRSIGDLAPRELKVIGEKLGMKDSSKTGEVFKTDIVNLSKVGFLMIALFFYKQTQFLYFT